MAAKKMSAILCELISFPNFCQVIMHLVARARHVPYRNHVLTEVLADSLGGSARCVMIACMSPADTQWPETRSTLECGPRNKFCLWSKGHVATSMKCENRRQSSICMQPHKLS